MSRSAGVGNNVNQAHSRGSILSFPQLHWFTEEIELIDTMLAQLSLHRATGGEVCCRRKQGAARNYWITVSWFGMVRMELCLFFSNVVEAPHYRRVSINHLRCLLLIGSS